MTIQAWRALYRELGFATIPLVPRGKRPLRKGWLTRGDEQWAGAPRDANVGILTGAASGGLVVLDFDTRDGPERVLGMTPEQLAVITIVVETSRGWHVYARGSRATCTPRAGLDVRGDGAMVVAPPSVHPSGHVYAFTGACRSLVPVDAIAGGLEAEAPVVEVGLLAAADAWVQLQAPRLRDAWGKLRAPPSMSWDASRADFAVARCLWEAGWNEDDVVDLLCSLPGSRASERGEAYARLTVARAFAARGPRARREVA